MNALGLESRLVQNPALGAVVLWRFARKYSDSHPVHAAAPLCLVALVLPMVWHTDTATNIASTQIASGLRAFADKFFDAQDSNLDALLAIHSRAARWRSKTTNALRIGFGSGLLRLNERGGLMPSDTVWQPAKHPSTVRIQTNVAEKLGAWFSALSLLEIAAIVHVRF